MRDVVDIGMGRTARRTYELKDIDIVAQRRTRSSGEVSLNWQIDAYKFALPFITHPTDAITSPQFAAQFAQSGGLAVINGEGIWARHRNAQQQIERIVHTAQKDPSRAISVLQELHSAPIDIDLLTQVVSDIRGTGAVAAVRVSPQLVGELAPQLVVAGVDILVVQGTIISAEHVNKSLQHTVNLKTFIAELDIPVIAGGVSDYRTALHLMRTGAAGVIVGYGAYEEATTTNVSLGISVPMATAIIDAAAARRDYLDETGGRYVHVIADGNIYTSGDLAKAIACGADAVMLGAPLVAAKESAAKGYFWPSTTAHPSLPRGSVTHISEAASPLETVLNGPSNTADGTKNLVGALRKSMAKAGYSDLKEFQKVALSVRGLS